MLIVGAPITNRAWAVTDWFELLAAQSRPPDAVALLWTSNNPDCRGHDETFEAIMEAARVTGLRTHVLADHTHPLPRHDNARFALLAALRNTLVAWVRVLGATEFFSLDTDIMLEDDLSIARLQRWLDEGYNTASPITWLHPLGMGSWAVNAGRWSSRDEGDPHRPWHRPEVTLGGKYDIDIPMAAVLMDACVLRHARYRVHEGGEDLGFAQSLEAMSALSAWDTGVRAPHMWDQRMHADWAARRAF